KDKSPRCVVKPRVTAQSKGDLPAYKGVFGSLDDALRSDKVISLMPSSDGRFYEMRRTELGTFIAPASCRGIQEVKAGFIPALPLVPRELTLEIIGFFRSLVNGGGLEAIVNILWDKEREAFCTFVPPQTVSHGSAAAELPRLHSRYLHYIDVHSHNTMPARFSAVDDADEKATRVYAVFGSLDRFIPEISVRISSGGSFSELDPLTVFEPIGKAYPESWNARVTTGGETGGLEI
ncbi:MAG: Mov34/MPN/PAD-1 family protein, partial [Oscillospiraceae bacterium]|nr:Mov34/MPN/PAD-1 family protein [Oscillospiraceae bacterium]